MSGLFNNKLQKVQLSMLDTDVQNKFSSYDTNITSNTVSLAEMSQQQTTNTNNIAANTAAINGLGTLKFIGVYATLLALQTAYPTGTNGIALVTADGYGYYWNGSAWTKGSVFQPTGIGDGTVIYSKLGSDVSSDLNNAKQGIAKIPKINGYPITAGYIDTGYVIHANDPNYVYTDFIPIDSSIVIDYALHGQSLVNIISFYDINKIPISGISTSNTMYTLTEGTVTSPSNAVFVRYCYSTKGGTYTDNEINQIINMNDINNKLISTENELNVTIDLCTSEKLSTGYIGTNGVVSNTTDTNWVYTDFIEFDPSYIINYILWGHTVIGSLNYYDANKNFIQSLVASSTTTPLTGTSIPPANTKYVRLSFTSVVSYPTRISSAKYTIDIKTDNSNIKKDITNLQEIVGTKSGISFISPYKVYTVCNDMLSTLGGYNRNYSSAIYLDHFFNGLSKELDIKFANEGTDKVVFSAPFLITSSDETNPTVTYNNGADVNIVSKSITITGKDAADTTFNVIHASTLNSKTNGKTPKILCIGDSITYGERAQVNDDNHSQNWAYHLMCKQFFMMDNIDNGNSGYDVRFLGHYQKTRNMSYNGNTYPVTTYHEGIRGISLSQYLNGQVADFTSPTTGLFSIQAWLNKYRTLDDNLNRLTVGNGTGSMITASNINNIDVCTPTHVLIMLGANGGGTIDQYRQLIQIIQTEFPNMIIGITLSDAAGTYFPSLHTNCSDQMAIWNDNGSQGSRHSQQYGLVQMLQNEYANSTSENNKVFFLPFYFVQPTAESFAMRRVDLPDQSIQLVNSHLYNEPYGWYPSTHINGIGHTNWGYQLYSWLKYTIAKALF